MIDVMTCGICRGGRLLDVTKKLWTCPRCDVVE